MLQRISQRLLLLILVAMFSLWAAAGFGVYQVTLSKRAIDTIGKDYFPSVETIDNAAISFVRIRIYLVTHTLLNDPNGKREAEAQIAQLRTDLQKSLQRYEALVSDDEDRRLFEQVKAQVRAFLQEVPELIELSRKNRLDLAIAHIDTSRHKALAALQAFLDHRAHTMRQVQGFVQTEDKIFQTTLVFMLALLVLSTAGLSWVAFATYRKVVGSTQRACEEVKRVAEQLDFSRPISVLGKDEVSELLAAFNTLMERLRASLGSICHEASELASASQELASASEQVRASSLSQADAAAAMAANVEQMTVSIGHVSDRTNEASSLSRSAGEQAQAGGESVNRTVDRIDAISSEVAYAAEELAKLEHSGRKIGTVVSVIKEVAEQTNLLALNAAIEAARAGEQGRGFAVVADEVRKLAERTALSTLEIAAMVADIQTHSSSVTGRMSRAVESVRAGVREGESTREAIEQISVVSTQNSGLVYEIAEALREQSSASNAIAGQVERVAQMSEENSRAAERSTELSGRLRELAATMQDVVLTYRL